MKSIRFRFLVAALAVMLGAAIAKSQTADSAPPPRMHERGFGMEGHEIDFFARYLDLTDTQRTQMKDVLHKEHATLKPLKLQLHQLDQQLMPYVQGTYDEAKVQGLVALQAQTLVQLKVQETRIHNELYQLLTPDQQAKVKEFIANREQKHMQNASENTSQQ
jgi:protein CpxP